MSGGGVWRGRGVCCALCCGESWGRGTRPGAGGGVAGAAAGGGGGGGGDGGGDKGMLVHTPHGKLVRIVSVEWVADDWPVSTDGDGEGEGDDGDTSFPIVLC